MRSLIPALYLLFALYHVFLHQYLSPHFQQPLNYRELKKTGDNYDRSLKRPPNRRIPPVLLMVIDGGTTRHLNDQNIAPHLYARWQKGGIRMENARSFMPSVTAPNIFGILSGAPPFLSGVTGNHRRFPACQQSPTLLDIMQARGISYRLIGFPWYREMFPGGNAFHRTVERQGPDSAEAAENLMKLIQIADLPPFTLIHFTAPDMAAHASGETGEHYIKTIREIDRLIGTIGESLERLYPEAITIVTSDHGMERDGHHGGSNGESIKVPLYFLGAGLPVQSSLEQVSLASLAPTVAVLMGIPHPHHSSGTIISGLVKEEIYLQSLQESIDRKEMLLQALTGLSGQSYVILPDRRETLRSRERNLSLDILTFPRKAESQWIYRQRLAAVAVLLVLLLLVIYRSGPGIPTLVILQMGMTGLAFTAAEAIDSHRLLVPFLWGFFPAAAGTAWAYTRFFQPPSLGANLPRKETVTTLLSWLCLSSATVSLLFIPLWSLIPDPERYRADARLLTLSWPYIFFILIFLLNRIKHGNSFKPNRGR